MNAEELRELCLSLNGTTEDIKWENHLCFSIGEKMYLILAPDETPVSASFKTTDELFDQLPSRDGMIPAPYMARHKWIHIDDIRRLSFNQWKHLITLARQTVFEKLPAKKQAMISGTSAVSKAKAKTVVKKKKVVAKTPSSKKKSPAKKKRS